MIVGQIPEVPDLPGRMIDRFPELEAYQAEKERWWNRFGELLQRDLELIKQLDTRLKASEATIVTMQSDVAALTSRLNALSP